MADVRQLSVETATLGSILRRAVPLAGLLLAVFLILPRISPFLLLAMAAPALALANPRRIDLARVPLSAAVAVAVYLLINSLWSLDRLDALGKSLLFVAIVVVLAIAELGLARIPDDALDRVVRVAICGLAVVLVFMTFEEYSTHLIKRTLFNWLPFLRPSEKHINLDGDQVAHIRLYVSNRNMAALMLSLWPVVMVLTLGGMLATGLRRWLAVAALLALTAITLAKSQHETSAIALVLSLVAVGVAMWSRRLALVLVGLAWIVSTMLVVPIASQAYQQNLHMASWLPRTARQRIIIWGYTAEQIAKTPIFGIGVGSGKVLDAAHHYETPPGFVYPRRTGTHSHNVFLQTWYELGAVGAVLLCALGLSLLLAIGRLEARLQPYALATFVSAAAIAAFSWGMWQPWFMAAFGISALLFLIASEHARRRPAGAAAGRASPD